MNNFSADIIFPIHLPPIKNGIVVVDDHGKIIDLLDPSKVEIPDSLPIKKFSGAICPGFVNSHCHLELSYLKGRFSQKKGLPVFIAEMVDKRDNNDDAIITAMTDADAEMYSSGIVAVGDISNNSDSINVKNSSKIYYHSFIELFDIFPERAESVFAKGNKLRSEFSEAGLKTSIVPHASYTVSSSLMKLICKNSEELESILCIHNQETASENEMFEKGSGSLIEKLRQITGAYADWIPTGKSSLRSVIEVFSKNHRLQLVHNTYTKREDVRSSVQIHPALFWCLCVNANIFIENSLPDVTMLMNEKCKLTLGTDSYASNISLSILEELKTISLNFPTVELNELLQWSTINGSQFLGIENRYGSFEKGKTPGINLISGIDLQKISLNKESQVERLF